MKSLGGEPSIARYLGDKIFMSYRLLIVNHANSTKKVSLSKQTDRVTLYYKVAVLTVRFTATYIFHRGEKETAIIYLTAFIYAII